MTFHPNDVHGTSHSTPDLQEFLNLNLVSIPPIPWWSGGTWHPYSQLISPLTCHSTGAHWYYKARWVDGRYERNQQLQNIAVLNLISESLLVDQN